MIDERLIYLDHVNNKESYYHRNHQGSIIALAQSTDGVSEGPYTYDAYGPDTG
ncbi:hypothetical protein [Kordiimonas pumila]|uniref:hypothetical protein n=1 Tax=Kordiimonas pumila TaxID=2161677 RepID=UPI0018840ED4|nr:hypothetical protein [Kordiimonas pumila]